MEKRQVFCVGLGIILSVLSCFVDYSSGSLSKDQTLERNGYGGGEREEVLLVKGLEEKEVAVTFFVGEREYTGEEAQKVLEQAAEELEYKILGENASLQEVNRPLQLISQMEEYGILVEWEPEDRELIGADGTVAPDLCPEGGQVTYLTARLRTGEYSAEYQIPVTVVPPRKTEEEARRERFLSLLRQMEESQRTSERFALPREYEGRSLSYREKRDLSFLYFPLLGTVLAVILPFLDRQKEQEHKKKKERQMLLDYPEIVSKLAVFTGAGLPVRKAWERMVQEYEQGLNDTSKKTKERAAYEEMRASCYRMQCGVPECSAYAEFGNRCGLLPYRKLTGLLEQNVRKGSESLRMALEAELEDAFEQQKTMIRRMGEEASTKLLLPLFLLLSIVMIMVSVPAFLAFGL